MFNKKAFFAAAVCTILLISGCAANKKTGSLRVRAVDGFTSAPICGASITVPETGKTYKTSADGTAGELALPVLPDEGYEKLLPSGEGRVTLIVRAEGYTPYLLLYARVKPGVCRDIDVLLFPEDGTLPVFTVIEAPDEAWCRQLIERFEP